MEVDRIDGLKSRIKEVDGMKDQIIAYIKRNRVSTTEVADCLGKSGSLHGIRAVNRGHFCVGEVFWTYASGSSNWTIHKDIQDMPEKSVLLIDVFDCEGRAVIGELVSKYALLYKQAAAIVVNGNIRDAENIVKENYAVWCQGFTPEGCFKTSGFKDIAEEMKAQRKAYYQGAIAVCDYCGVVIIPQQYHTLEFLKKLEAIEEQEDIWFDCIDRKKWTTFETVCLEKYSKKEDGNV